MNSPDSYFMNDARETKRLADKVDADAWVARYLSPHLNGATKVLDVGCGPGAIVAAAAAAYPDRHFTGIDLCKNRFESMRTASALNIDLRLGDATSIPFPDESFDVVYCRFLLEYLAERQSAIGEMVRVCKPGGTVILQDLDGQLVWHYPEEAEFESQLRRVIDGLARTGFDPFVGRKLFSFARLAGLQDLRVSAESYHLFAGRIDSTNERLWETKLDIALPAITKILGSPDEAVGLRNRFMEHLRRDDTLTYSIIFTVAGKKSIAERRAV